MNVSANQNVGILRFCQKIFFAFSVKKRVSMTTYKGENEGPNM
jgi:hypothetical protein